MPPKLDPIALTCRDAAAALALGTSTVRKLVATGAIRSIRIGRAVRIPRDALAGFLRERSLEHEARANPPQAEPAK